MPQDQKKMLFTGDLCNSNTRAGKMVQQQRIPQETPERRAGYGEVLRQRIPLDAPEKQRAPRADYSPVSSKPPGDQVIRSI